MRAATIYFSMERINLVRNTNRSSLEVVTHIRVPQVRSMNLGLGFSLGLLSVTFPTARRVPQLRSMNLGLGVFSRPRETNIQTLALIRLRQRLIQKQKLLSLRVRHRPRSLQMHNLIPVFLLVLRPVRQSRAIRIPSPRKICPVRPHLL
jgi:hypothetical protein